MTRPVLVVGGAGYIGSHACKALARAGYLPVTLDNLSRGHREVVKWGPLEQGDIGDRAFVDAVLARHKPLGIMHFAALIEVGESVNYPARFYRNNVCATLTLLEAMLDAGIRNFVFSSTCATYGMPERVPMDEETPQDPVSPYGRTKLAVEWMLRDLALSDGLRWMALRYFNACGADAAGETGEWHDPETHLIPRVLMAAAGVVPKVTLFGTDYPTPDGTCVRDYIHVSDLAAAHVSALELLLSGGASQAINLGTGAGFSVREIIAAVERVTGRTVPVEEAPRRPGNSPSLVADPSRARSMLGFATPNSEIDNVIATAWNWHQKAWRRENAPAGQGDHASDDQAFIDAAAAQRS